jgi:hypothetical protein
MSIYYGKAEPLKAVGKNQCHLLDFAFNNPGWHTFKNDRATVRAVRALESRGVIETSNDQFKIKL